MTEVEMFGWHHRLDGHEFEQALGVGDGQGSLVCYSPWGHKELDMTEQLNNSHIIYSLDLEPRVQKSVLYICVSFAVSHIGLSLPSF